MTKSKKRKLVVIEGADGSGKGTQVALLEKRLGREGYSVRVFDFPRYNTSRTGKFVGDVLKGKHGDMLTISPYLTSLPYMLDRAAARPAMEAAFIEGAIILCNRYTPSNLAHGGAKIADPEERAAFIEHIEAIEYSPDELGILRPTLVIYLAVPTDISAQLVEKKSARAYLAGGAKDQHEADPTHQASAAAVYRELANARDDWQLIECMHENILRTPDDIHEEVWGLVAEHLTAT